MVLVEFLLFEGSGRIGDCSLPLFSRIKTEKQAIIWNTYA